MGISLYTAMVIQNNKDHIKCSAASDKEGKWAGEISLWKNDYPHTALITTNFNYDSEKEAVDDMERIISAVCCLDLFKEIRRNQEEDRKKEEEDAKRNSAGFNNKS